MAPPAVEGGGQRRQQQQGGFSQTVTGIIRVAVFWYFASRLFSPKKPTRPSSSGLISNLFHKGQPLDMWLYLSEQHSFNDFGSEGSLVWHETNIPYASWGPHTTRSLTLTYRPSQALKNNGSLYAHVFFAHSGYSPDPSDPEYQPQAAFGRTHSVVKCLPKTRADKRGSLLGSEGQVVSEICSLLISFWLCSVTDDTGDDSEGDGPFKWVSYWKPNVTINLVADFMQYPENDVPPNVAPHLSIDPITGNYLPTVFFIEFWLLRDELIPMNDTVTDLVLNLERVFLEGNPYLLAVTMIVSLLHSVFDFLAFKNDIQFWSKNKSMEGLSAKSVVMSFASQVIVFLYLLDHDTSWMILASSGIGCIIEFWKIGKAMHRD